ncbi:hypothetical protein AK812_SmicGene30748 [Symbiodinium microadriaticum]|uniref:Uncharacterized protein n=1 Tax=Symbiodinium microadriaticum TaxID=2951 RepID=A0A1Q9CYG5_SYMMI|nr:hypothetical protein AK812_SmicGene30748 [Symbiodinium microadriaticum]
MVSGFVSRKVILLDGDVLIKGDLLGLLQQQPISASKDLADAFNYGVVVLKPDATIHRDLVRLLVEATEEDLHRYNTRTAKAVGLCDQTLVAGRLAELYKINFFEDMRKSSRQNPQKWLMSTEYNLVVSYRAKERCDLPGERKRVHKARIIHFANNWLNFETLAKAAFHYWHDVYNHALSDRSTDPPPAYTQLDFESDDGLATPDEVQAVFLDFQSRSRKFEKGPGCLAWIGQSGCFGYDSKAVLRAVPRRHGAGALVRRAKGKKHSTSI